MADPRQVTLDTLASSSGDRPFECKICVKYLPAEIRQKARERAEAAGEDPAPLETCLACGGKMCPMHRRGGHAPGVDPKDRRIIGDYDKILCSDCFDAAKKVYDREHRGLASLLCCFVALPV